MFTQQDIEHFEIVYHLVKEKGMTIQGTREYFQKNYDSRSLKKLEAINTLKRVKELLSDIKEVMDQNRTK
jgi:DNA-binding transcriptional MerR regulator